MQINYINGEAQVHVGKAMSQWKQQNAYYSVAK